MKVVVFLIVLIFVMFIISGCLSSNDDSKSLSKSSTNSNSEYVPKSNAPSCDREAEAHKETDRAMAYCKRNPYGTYRGSVCGVPINVVC